MSSLRCRERGRRREQRWTAILHLERRPLWFSLSSKTCGSLRRCASSAAGVHRCGRGSTTSRASRVAMRLH